MIKSYFYLNQGLTVLNNFRNLGLGIFAAYFALKLDSPIILIVMFIVSVPVLIIIGYYYVHKVSKVSEQLTIKHGTHYGIAQFELIEKQTNLLEEICKKIQHHKN